MAAAAPPVGEVPVDSLPAAVLAVEAGAARLELCAGLGEGGSTPSLGLLEAVRAAVEVPVFVLVRPRAGSFVLEPGEQDLVRRDLEHAVRAGADGVVVGALTAAGALDLAALQAWRDAAPGASFTLHRAFDEVSDRAAALEALASSGVAPPAYRLSRLMGDRALRPAAYRAMGASEEPAAAHGGRRRHRSPSSLFDV